MPLYRWKCDTCGAFESGFAKIAERDEPRKHLCDGLRYCGQEHVSPMTRVLEAPQVRPDITPYQSPVDGRWIDSRSSRNEDLKRNGAREWHPEVQQEAAQNLAYHREESFKEIDKMVDEIAPAILAANPL